MALPTGRGLPSAGFRCMSRPGPALTSTMAPRCSCQRARRCLRPPGPRRRRPGRPMRAASVTAYAASGWTRSVTSKATLPLRWISTLLAGRRHASRPPGPGGRFPGGRRSPACTLFERAVLAAAAARVGVDLPFDEVFDGVPAVASDPCRLAARRRDHAVAHHQQAVLVAGHEALDQDAAAFFLGHGVGGARPLRSCIRLVNTPRPWLPS